ncbi:MAG: putative ski2-type helicase [Candidatus Thorarchaeota archaeon]|nr:MAG: putative ski2-type helicase [Candidatus Thorarchaeota archaeon]
MSFFSILGENIERILSGQGISSPTPIQKEAIPQILDGLRNILLLAPTGSGKTEAALIPLLRKLEALKTKRELFGFYIIYITPLRALNRDVFSRIQEICHSLELSVDVRHGDTTQYQRRKQAIHPPNLLITTPESLQAILPGKRLRYHLKTVFAVIVDEIHELAGSKRGTQLSLGLERLEKLVGTSIQRIGLSATVGNPKDVAKLLQGGSRQVKTIWAGYQKRRMDIQVEVPIPEDHHKILGRKISYPPHSTARLERIIDLIESHQSTLIFTNTRSFAEVLGAKMRSLKPDFEYDVHHGSLSKEVRLDAERRLKGGISRAIIATSSLELGIDIGQADLVIQYSSPREVSRALQRIGRSGHGIGRVAKGRIIATVNADDITESGVILRRAKINKVEEALIPQKTWDVLCHQIAGILLDLDEIPDEHLYALIRKAYPFKSVRKNELDNLLSFMEQRKMLRVEGNLVKRGPRARSFYYEHLSTIPDIQKVNAVDMSTRSSIGVLDEDYVISDMELGSVFVIKGRPWHVVAIDEETGEVLCSPAHDTNIQAPRWIGEMIPVPLRVATEVAKVWKRLMEMDRSEAYKWSSSSYGISGPAFSHTFDTIKESEEVLGENPTEDLFIIEDFWDGLVLHAPMGTKANETLGLILAALLTTRMGSDVAVERDPYRILFTSKNWIDPEYIKEILREYNAEQIDHVLRLAIKHTQNFATRFMHVGRRMSIIRKDAKMKEIPIRKVIQNYEGTPVYEEAMREVLTEKLELETVEGIFERVSRGKLNIHIVKTTQPSPLARLIIEEKTRFEVMGEITEEDEVLRVMEERLLSKRFKLSCVNGDWSSVRTISTLEDKIECPICGSSMIAALHQSNKEYEKVLRKRKTGKSLSSKEQKEFLAGSLTAELVSNYGKKALLVLAGRGIGPRTAGRILRPGLNDRKKLLRAIAKGEQEYARTRPFWR